jgi:hypothetical protein
MMKKKKFQMLVKHVPPLQITVSFWNQEAASPELAYRNVSRLRRGLALKKLQSSYFSSRFVHAADKQQTLTQQLIPLTSICHGLYSETMNNLLLLLLLLLSQENVNHHMNA